MRVVERLGMVFAVEETLEDYVHACTVQDIVHVFSNLPRELLGGGEAGGRLAGVLLRQPTRRQALLQPVWGRYLYWSHSGPIRGPAILLEAVRVPMEVRWGRRLGVEKRAELERLRAEATEVVEERRHVVLRFDLDAARGLLLYRTLLHELGHKQHYFAEVERWQDEDIWEVRWERYWSRPPREREDFAHRFAREWGERLRERGVIPFDRIGTRRGIELAGLRPEDFVAPGNE